jgi:cyclic di-GMP phosphodiesterase
MTHPPAGEGICRPLRAVTSVLPFIKHHHERYDGNGYPDGLRGSAVPLLAQITGIADVFDALTNDRPYRRALDARDALDELWRDATRGRHDRTLVAEFATVVSSNGADGPASDLAMAHTAARAGPIENWI